MKTAYVTAKFPRQAVAIAKEELGMPHGRVVEIKHIKRRKQWRVTLQ